MVIFTPQRKREWFFFSIILFALALIPFTIFISEFTGFFVHEAEGGYIYNMDVRAPMPVNFWAGFYGVVQKIAGLNESNFFEGVTPGIVEKYDLVLSDFGNNSRDFYAARIPWSEINPASVKGITTDFLDIYLNATPWWSWGDSATQMFHDEITVNFGGRDITTIAAYSHSLTQQNDHNLPTFVLYDQSSDEFIFGTFLTETTGFNGDLVNYQLLVALKKGTNDTFYFFSDPTDISSYIGQIVLGGIEGYVTDKLTTEPVANVSVFIAGTYDTTDNEGYYKIVSLGEGRHVITAQKENYFPYYNMTSIVRYAVSRYDIAIDPYTGPNYGNSTLIGLVLDNETQEPLDNVTISILNQTFVTEADGRFEFTLIEGEHILLAAKPKYESYATTVELEIRNTTNITIYLDPFYDEYAKNGTISGYVFDNFNGSVITNASVYIGDQHINSSVNGTYSIEIPAGIYPFITVKEGYKSWIDIVQVNITSNSQYDVYLSPIYLNFTMEETGVVQGNITLIGDDTFVDFFNLTITSGGLVYDSFNSSNYSMRLPEGDYYLTALGPGYNPWVSPFTIVAGNYTKLDINFTSYTPPGLGPGKGPGSGPGSGAGSGPGMGIPGDDEVSEKPAIAMPKDLRNYWIAPNEIVRKLEINSFSNEEIAIYNLKSDSIFVNYSLKGDISKFITLDKQTANINPRREDRTKFTVYGYQTGTFVGYIVVKGDIFAAIPVTLTITKEQDAELKAVLVSVDLADDIYEGEPIKIKLSFDNLLNERIPVRINYRLEQENSNKTYFLGDDTFSLVSSRTLIKNFNLTNLSLGYYTFTADVSFNGKEVSSSVLIPIIPKPVNIWNYKVFGFIPSWILILIGGVLFVFLWIQKKIAKQLNKNKRFQFELNLHTLPSRDDENSLMVGMIAEKPNLTYFDMKVLTVHSIVAGTTGGGKSIAAQTIIEECLKKNVSIVVFDPTAQWTGMLRKCVDPHFLELYPKFKMDPKEARAFPGNVRPIFDARVIVDIMKYTDPGQITVFTTNTLDPHDYDIFVANSIRTIFKSNLSEHPVLRVMLVYDEIHRILPKFGGTGQGFIQIERACREFRKWGLGVLLISQVLQDFVGEIKANINTQIQMKTRDEGDLKAIEVKYGADYVRGLIKAPVGTGMVQNAAWNRGIPYYVTFRPILHSTKRLTDEELSEYNTYNQIIDDLEFQLQQLEELGNDILDLKLELKLSKDKLKSGSFNMVKIYLDGLTPRITAYWEKIGKTPKKFEVQMVSEDDLKAEIDEAKKARKKFEDEKKDEAPAEEAPAEEEKPMDPEMAEANIKAVTELSEQVKDAIKMEDVGRFNELVIEISNIPLPKENKEARDKSVEELKAAWQKHKDDKEAEKKKLEAVANGQPVTPETPPQENQST